MVTKENFDFAKDNINGVSKRKKLRFRWYNKDLNNVYFEEKKKRDFFKIQTNFKVMYFCEFSRFIYG